ncbi:TonB-dependent receptor domain-containing protein [Aquidulcibacter sp.]|jgi:outer membrane receptor for ferrienterochelin and colicin|uniref:TonB-dependent receptor plug domain-containing protein n=1 Tax=Aquidulcibacter sp. TaxID=2052990 RepID=UPI0028A5EF18|nr:TonB-dependent receptor [Aquidulcibacter sp.]
MALISYRALAFALVPLLLVGTSGLAPAWAQTTISASPASGVTNALPDLVDGKRTFQPAYFNDITPQTAADMVARIPGFNIDDGESVRGFGGAAGNVLIDGSRPTSKNEDLFSILGRIPASNVEKVELLEGAAAGALAPGKRLVVNVIRKTDNKASGKWEVQATGVGSGRIKPKIDTSYTSKLGGFNVTTGLQAEIENVEDFIGFEGILSPSGIYTERGPNDDRRRSKYAQATFAVDGKMGTTKINANASYMQGEFHRNWVHVAYRPNAALPFRVDEGRATNETLRWEVGGDLEREMAGWTGKLALLAKATVDQNSDLAGFNLVGQPKNFGRFVADSTNEERVARLTFKKKFGAHQIETGGELAYNSLDLVGQYAEGNGTIFVVRPSDISSTEVSETRKEAFISDSWTLSPKLTLESTLTGEWSTIEQSGAAGKERSFFYPKPRIKAAWKPKVGWTYRVEVERVVGQLDFDAFADSASVGDNNQNSGNPELRPEQAWSSLIGVERRWGKRGVINASLIQEKFEDQLTLVPTRNGGVALGNVPEAERWGYNVSWTVPLPMLLEGLEFEGSYRWRDSELTDPITNQARPFSGWNGNSFEANVRYEMPKKRLRMGAWLWRGDNNREYRPSQTFQWSTIEFWGAWIETKAYKNVSFELGVEDPNGNTFNRVRTDFTPDRRSGVISQTQYRERSKDGIWYLLVKSTF